LSPTIYRRSGFVFYFFGPDVLSGEPPHVHVGKGSQNPNRDAKIWLDPVTVARQGAFGRRDLRRARAIVEENQQAFLERWHEIKDRG
jgi:hypothetical protein